MRRKRASGCIFGHRSTRSSVRNGVTQSEGRRVAGEHTDVANSRATGQFVAEEPPLIRPPIRRAAVDPCAQDQTFAVSLGGCPYVHLDTWIANGLRRMDDLPATRCVRTSRASQVSAVAKRPHFAGTIRRSNPTHRSQS